MCNAIYRGGYGRIKRNVCALLDSIDSRYDNIIQPYIDIRNGICRNVNVADDDAFQKTYKDYFKLGRVLSSEWIQDYFRLMNGGVDGLRPRQDERLRGNHNEVTDLLLRVIHHLRGVYFDCKKKDRVDFSFSTKLLHVLNPDLPIYDSTVREFYCLRGVSGGNADARIRKCAPLYKHLISEYQCVLDTDALAGPIAAFRRRFRGRGEEVFTDIKVIDTLIWRFNRLQQ